MEDQDLKNQMQMQITPSPIDTNRLANMLGGAKTIMDKVTSGDYEVGNIDARALNEDGVQEMMAEGITRPQAQAVAPNMVANQPMYRNMESSTMPDVIKEAMVNTPIPQASMTHTFNIEDVQTPEQRAIAAQKYPSTPQTNPNQQQPIYAQAPLGANTDGTFTVSESALRAIVNDMLLDFMTKTFTQNLSENVIKKTINTLIKEGKIGVKKKK